MLLIRQAILAIKPAFEQILGINSARMFVVMLLKTEGEISQSEIQKRMGIDRAMITRLVKQMEADGWVVRRTNPADNRYTLVQLSELGIVQHQHIMVKIEEIESLLMVGMKADEIACLERSMIRIRQNAENITNGKKVEAVSLAGDYL